MSGEEIPVTDEAADEWGDELEAPGENVDPVIAGTLFCVLGGVLLLLSVPGLAVLIGGGTMTAYGNVGAGILFISGLLVAYFGGVIVTEQKHGVWRGS